MVLSVGA